MERLVSQGRSREGDESLSEKINSAWWIYHLEVGAIESQASEWHIIAPRESIFTGEVFAD